MSDLIHEGPKDPNKPPVPGEEKPTTERERMKKVYTYVAILFTVAFLLILWTFLMNQRSINEIKDGNTALQIPFVFGVDFLFGHGLRRRISALPVQSLSNPFSQWGYC